MDLQEFQGQFWLPGFEKGAASGRIVVTPGASSVLQLSTTLNRSVRVKPGSEPLYRVAPMPKRPSVVLGVLADGSQVSVLRCVVMGQWKAPQVRYTQIVVGAHLNSPDARFESSRFWPARLEDLLSADTSGVHLAGGATLAVEQDQGRSWLSVTDPEPRTLGEWDQRYHRPTSVLVALATGVEAHVRRQVQWEGQWLDVVGQWPGEGKLPDAPLLGIGDLPLSAIGRWLDHVEDYAGLSPVVMDSILGNSGTLETRTLLLTTVAEGVHRRIPPRGHRFSKAVEDKIRRAAREAIREIEPDLADEVSKALLHSRDWGYATRVEALGSWADFIAPGCVGVLNDSGAPEAWRTMVAGARNGFAHRDPRKGGLLTDADVDRFLTVAESMEWVLRIVLFWKVVGLDPTVLTARVSNNSRHRFFMENVAEWSPALYGVVDPSSEGDLPAIPADGGGIEELTETIEAPDGWVPGDGDGPLWTDEGGSKTPSS
jgi:hypothetical protein